MGDFSLILTTAKISGNFQETNILAVVTEEIK
jgi:hypothetical protein